MIPRTLIRSVPTETSAQIEAWWQHAVDLHPDWQTITYRDPIDSTQFPITTPVWSRCRSGAQLAGLIRLEALYTHGGIWLDSDVELFRPLDPLLEHRAFAAREDQHTIPDAVLGAEPHHLAIVRCLTLAVDRIRSDSTDWSTGNGAWATGPGVTSTVFPGRDDVTILDAESFFPVHYTEKEKLAGYTPGPDTYGLHHWAASWL